MQLKPGQLLQGGKFKIIQTLGQGGFGITYLAEQTNLGREVCIKEFFMKEYCNRDEATSRVSLGTQNNAAMMQKYQVKFLKEARLIARLDHPNIIRIHDVFTENNTAYYVMDYIDGKNINEIVKERGALPEAVAIEYVRQIGEGLMYVHGHNINHLDIKPGNILVRKSDNRPILIDFGMSKQYNESGDQTSSTPLGISAGYAPLEMYQAGGVSSFTPQTDVYGLGATLYYMVTGAVPPSASDVMNDGLPEMPGYLSDSIKTAIEKAMEFRKKDRPETIGDFLVLLGTPVSSQIVRDSPAESSSLNSINDQTTITEGETETVIVPDVSEDVHQNERAALIDSRRPEPLSTEPRQQGTSDLDQNKKSKVIIGILGSIFLFGVLWFLYNDNHTASTPTVPEHDYITIGGTRAASVSFDAGGGKKEFDINKNFDQWTYSQKPDWCSISIGSNSFTIVCSANQSTNSRSAVISFNKVGSAVKLSILKVSQAGASSPAKATPAPSSPNTTSTPKPSSTTSSGTNSTPAPKASTTTSSSNRKMSLSQRSVSLTVGESVTLVASDYGSSISWESDNPQIATVSSTGKVTAVAAGIADIWAKGSEYLRCEVRVVNNNTSSSTINKQSSAGSNVIHIYVTKGETKQLSLPNTKVDRWETDDRTIATVVSNSGVMYALKKGETNVWAYYGNTVQRFVIHVQ